MLYSVVLPRSHWRLTSASYRVRYKNILSLRVAYFGCLFFCFFRLFCDFALESLGGP